MSCSPPYQITFSLGGFLRAPNFLVAYDSGILRRLAQPPLLISCVHTRPFSSCSFGPFRVALLTRLVLRPIPEMLPFIDVATPFTGCPSSFPELYSNPKLPSLPFSLVDSGYPCVLVFPFGIG